MKKTKVIIPALGLLVLSTAASVSGTVAWFSMNTYVTASGMQLQGKAESGIVIANAADASTWANSATALNSGAGVAVIPTSTSAAVKWFHSSSNSANSATSNGSYSQLSITEVNGVGFVDGGNPGNGAYDSATENAYFLHNQFFIKSSAEQMTKPLYVNQVKVTGNTNSANFDKCFRVLVKMDTTVKIFAPFTGATTSYTVADTLGDNSATTDVTETDYPTATASVSAVAVPANYIVNTSLAASTTIPAYSATPITIDVYLYFEGEDANCMSAYLSDTMDNLALELMFGTAEYSAS